MSTLYSIIAALSCIIIGGLLVVSEENNAFALRYQQMADQAMTVQEYNQEKSLELSCRNFLAFYLKHEQPAKTEFPRECLKLLARKLAATYDFDELSSMQRTTTDRAESFGTERFEMQTEKRRQDGDSIAVDGGTVNGEIADAANRTVNGSQVAMEHDIYGNFNRKLYQYIAPNRTHQNVVYAPISLLIILALTYTGSEGQTATELRTALELSPDKMVIYEQFSKLPKTQRKYDFQLQMANKLYYNFELSINAEFERNAMQYFEAEIESVEFAHQFQTAKHINRWVASKTNERILNLIEPQTLDAKASAIFVNAIYFRAKWAKEFSVEETQRHDFAASLRRKVPVNMMYNEDVFGYAEIRRLDAKVLQLPYRDTDLSMLVLLPRTVEGLAALESRMRDIDILQLPARLQQEMVRVQLPKFRIEFELDMVDVLRKLKIETLFTDHAELYDIFVEHGAGISKVQHKAFIDVNEAGSEATAATFNKLIPLSLPTNLRYFKADHPFMFAIISPQTIYFMGHVVDFS